MSVQKVCGALRRAGFAATRWFGQGEWTEGYKVAAGYGRCLASVIHKLPSGHGPGRDGRLDEMLLGYQGALEAAGFSVRRDGGRLIVDEAQA